MMRFKFLVPVLAVMVFAAVSDAGPLRNFFRARFGGGCGSQASGCSSCGGGGQSQGQFQQTAYTAGYTHQVVYPQFAQQVPFTGGDGYTPIRLGVQLPTVPVQGVVVPCPTCPSK
jgi:hypothetical protein